MKRTLFSLSLLCAIISPVNATDTDVITLDNKVNTQVQKIAEATGLLATSVEAEIIMGDIVDKEVTTTDLTSDQAVEKYQLTPTLERYIKIKEASRTGDGIHPCPCP